MKIVITILFLSIYSNANNLKCQWWQSKIHTHQVRQHQRNSTTVSVHNRKEHCREKWNGADLLITHFSNHPIKGWPHKENFKTWKRHEMELLLKILSSLPDWTEKENYAFYRADKSEAKGNPSTSEVTRGSIVLYDQFFKSKAQSSILVHESGHHLFKKLSDAEVEEFASLSGWRMEATKDRKVFILPPEKLIKSDSVISKEEDFTNHLEVFYENENEYKKKYPQTFDFLKKRYSL